VSILKRGRFTPHKGGVIEKFSVRTSAVDAVAHSRRFC